ncbi:MAG: helix-turn-helix transcriptional regulator [Candidatus Glassbacteria bacterium]
MTPADDQKRIIGENIKAARKLRGLSQRALAEKLGIAFQNLSVWENGKGAPSAKYLLRLAEILNISLDQLTSKEGITASLERATSRLSYTGHYGAATTVQADPALLRVLENEIPKYIKRELAENHTFKLVIAYLEEILSILRSSSGRQGLRQAAESFTGYSRVMLSIPLPPKDLSKEEKIIWDQNAATLLKWAESELAFWVPEWAMTAFCRNARPSPYGENLDDVAFVLKQILDKGN